MTSHKAVHVASANAPLTLVDVETSPPGPGRVRITVAACGVCGTDHGFVVGGFPNMTWPLTLGHEIAGTISELGDGVEGFAVGDRVAVGWFGGNCNRCIPCRQGKFMQCVNGEVPSWHYPGGYAESVVAPATALARIPDELSFTEAAPMGCAGVTTYNALRQTKAKAGDRKSTRLNSSHPSISYAVFCLKKKKSVIFNRESVKNAKPTILMSLSNSLHHTLNSNSSTRFHTGGLPQT